MNYPKNRYSGVKPWMDREWLYNEYVVKDRSSQDIADEYGCKRNTIQQWLATFKIKKKVVCNRKVVLDKPYKQKDYLIREYIDNRKSMSKIGRENGVSADTIRRFLVYHNIEVQSQYKTNKFAEQEEAEICRLYSEENISANALKNIYHCTHGTILHIIRKHGLEVRNLSDTQLLLNHKTIPELFHDKTQLYELYWGQRLSCNDLSGMTGISAGAIRRQMQRMGIKTRDDSESKMGLMVGEKHPNWQGGITDLTARLREYFGVNQVPAILKRDHYTCQICGHKHTNLHVHHISHFSDIVHTICNEHPELDVKDNVQELYDIIVKDPRFLDSENLITYCADCHLYKVHGYQCGKSNAINTNDLEGIYVENNT